MAPLPRSRSSVSPICTVAACDDLAKGVTRCGRTLCELHAVPKYHPCLLLPADRQRGRSCKDNHDFYGLFAQIVDAPIVADAVALRPEATSGTLELPVVTEYMKEYRGHIKWMGYRNIALKITFNDGVRWLARVRLNDIYTPAVRRSIMLSEYATLMVLQEMLGKLVPRVWLPPQDPNFEFTYLLMEFVEGQSLHSFFDAKAIHEMRPPVKAAVSDYAEIMIKLASRSFNGVGSLYPAKPSGYTVGPALSDIRGSVPTIGPFRTSQDLHLARIDHYLNMVQVTTLRPPELAGNPVRILRYLVALELRDLIRGCTEMAREGATYIKHTDDAAHNMLGVDGRINAIIDWEMALVVPFAEAFSAPLAFLPLDETTLESNGLTKAEEALISELERRGRPDIANAVRGGRKYHCLLRLVDGPAIPGATGGITLTSIWGTRQAFLGAEAGEKPASLEDWYADALAQYANEPGLEATVDGLVNWTTLNADLATAACDEVEDHLVTLRALLDVATPQSSPNAIAIERETRAIIKAVKQARRASNAASRFGADCREAVAPAQKASAKMHASHDYGFRKMVHSFGNMLHPRKKDKDKGCRELLRVRSTSPRRASRHSPTASAPTSRRGSADITALTFGTSPASSRRPSLVDIHRRVSGRTLDDIAHRLETAADEADNAARSTEAVAEKGLAAVAAAQRVAEASGVLQPEGEGDSSAMSD
ncbi:hypothetical protein CspeluHIS016_0200070 [Cutaneotrichosporon spelunceum]|uniref:Aminoglycoside phosphotransferase domain-containing protein n=1 Tax=Cutaneotrichosporon spelunceum TaxID=1672016 RepID=A0AAD3Y9I9_9TREE|nr:hypothetical protein CspeluHIS016_0200070 [Cutaneotrichosporon spelunceum]